MVGETVILARGVGKSFRGTGRATSIKERILRMGHGVVEPFQALRDVDLEIDGRPVGRADRPQRVRQVDAAEGPHRDPAAHHRHGRGERPGLVAAGARRRLQRRAVRPRQRLPERVAARPVPQGDRGPVRLDRRVLRARGVHRQPGQALLVGHVRPARLRRRRARRPGHPAGRRGARGRRRGVRAQVPGQDRRVPARGADDPVRHPRARPGRPDLRPGRRARPRPGGLRRRPGVRHRHAARAARHGRAGTDGAGGGRARPRGRGRSRSPTRPARRWPS